MSWSRGSKERAEYGKAVLKTLSGDLAGKFGRGFSVSNLEHMRLSYLDRAISQTLSGISAEAATAFPLPWSHYVTLLGVKKDDARKFYKEEAIRGGWSMRQLKRQIGSQFFERTLLSKNKVAMLRKGQRAERGRFRVTRTGFRLTRKLKDMGERPLPKY